MKSTATKWITALFATFVLSTILATPIYARDAGQITDWYIKDFQSDIVVNTDSSLDITEKISADCGNLPDKHGIFRVLPLFYQKTAKEKVKTPIKLQSITDFDGTPYTYTETKTSETVTWKIGNPDKTVTGVNNYKIVYHIDNTIRFDNAAFDEFYWNLNGNFWDIDTDNFQATIHFPVAPISQKIDLYSGNFEAKDNKQASYSWTDNKTLVVRSTQTLFKDEGITASVSLPKNVITPYVPTLMEKYGQYFWLLLPLLAFWYAFSLWRKYGRDPKLNKPEMAQYEPPAGLGPIETGLVMTNLRLDNHYLSAGIINLAVKGFIKIEEVAKKGLLGKKDFRIIFQKSDFAGETNLSPAELKLAQSLHDFADGDTLNLSGLENKFYRTIDAIKTKAKDYLFTEGLFGKEGFRTQTKLFVFSGAILVGFFILFQRTITYYPNPAIPVLSVILAVISMIIFAILMPSRTQKGAETLWQIQGFKLFMTTADKYTAPFHEKEGLFEKYLPYAMVFGITSMWINNMKKIYGEDYFNTYHPIWYYGYLGTFNADSLTSSMDSLASTMASTLASSPSSSGAGGGGFSGGGGGGGGGGGW